VRLFLAIAGTAILGFAPAAAPRITLAGHVYPGGGYSADVYAHDGFAYLSSYHGLACGSQGVRVYDLHNLTHPRRVATFADGASELEIRGTWTEKTIVQHVSTPSFKGEVAVVSFQNCTGTNAFRGFGLYDVTNPHRPVRLSLVRTDPGGSHEIWLQDVHGKAYVYTAIPVAESQRPFSPGFRIFNVSDPRNPVEVGSWIAPAKLREGKDVVFVHSVRVNPAATRAYLSYWDLGTVILDISNPAHPRYLGRTHDTQPDAHSTALSANGKLMVETHEVDGGRPSFWDVSNPRNPRLLGTFDPPKRLLSAARKRAGAGGFLLGVHDPKIVGKRAYFSWYTLGVLVVNISNPRHPKFVAQLLPPVTRDPDREFCPGRRCSVTWGVYATKHYVLAGDMVGGLWVYRVR
jgi:hypothetical protein